MIEKPQRYAQEKEHKKESKKEGKRAKWKLDTTGILISGIEMMEFKNWKLQNLKQE